MKNRTETRHEPWMGEVRDVLTSWNHIEIRRQSKCGESRKFNGLHRIVRNLWKQPVAG